MLRVAIVSDVHYAGPRESARRGRELDPIVAPWQRWLVRAYRRHLWLENPCAHNHQLNRFVSEARGADLVVANGDFACDFACLGVMDDEAFESASLSLRILRNQFGPRFRATIGDHELGKKMLAADVGGFRLPSYWRATVELGLEPFWRCDLGAYLLMGITSSLVALPIYQVEGLPEEIEGWQTLRAQHLDQIRTAFLGLEPSRRVLLFCHDPSALPFLLRETAIQERLGQIERTIIGHLHSPAVLRRSRMLSGMPRISFLGHTITRLSSAVREARVWEKFRPLLCPSLTGLQCLRDGGFYTVDLDPTGMESARFIAHPLPW